MLCDDSCGRPPLHSALAYTLFDIGGSLCGSVVFAMALFAPGYVAGRFLNIAGFREKSAAGQAAWSVALSFGLGTIPIVASTWVVGVTATGIALAVVGLIALVLWIRSGAGSGKIVTRDILFVGVWMLLVVLSLVDIGIGPRLWMSVTAYDHSVRTAFVDAAMRSGVVPVNPLYWPGHDAPLRYYYFWYVVCAVVAKLAHISARQAFIASCVWPMFAVVAMLALYGKYLLGWTGNELRSRTRLGIVLLTVTGLDVLVTLFNWLAGGATPGDMEWWSIDQVTSWVDTFLWVPHHAAALVCCLLSFLLIWMTRIEPRKQRRVTLGAVAGISFASAFGLSTYVAIGFCFVMLAWLVRIIFTLRQAEMKTSAARMLRTSVLAALVAVIVLSPYVVQLLRHNGVEQQPIQHLLKFEVRQMLDPGMLSNLPGMARLGVFARTEISALMLLLPGYAVELGFFVIAILLALRLPQKSEGERTLLFLFFAGLISASFLRSAVISTNDYGVRASLLAQFFAVLLAARACEMGRMWWRYPLVGLAIIGICGTVYQVAALRLFLPWQQAHGNPAMRELAERNYAMREAYTLFDQRAPAGARLQYDPVAGGYFGYTHMLNARRQIVTADAACNTGFGGEIASCAQILRNVQALFPPLAHNPPSAESATALCSEIGIQYLVATRWDAAWQDPAGWPWHLPVVLVTPDVRIVACSMR